MRPQLSPIHLRINHIVGQVNHIVDSKNLFGGCRESKLHSCKKQGQYFNIMIACMLHGYFDLKSFVFTLKAAKVKSVQTVTLKFQVCSFFHCNYKIGTTHDIYKSPNNYKDCQILFSTSVEVSFRFEIASLKLFLFVHNKKSLISASHDPS